MESAGEFLLTNAAIRHALWSAASAPSLYIHGLSLKLRQEKRADLGLESRSTAEERKTVW